MKKSMFSYALVLSLVLTLNLAACTSDAFTNKKGELLQYNSSDSSAEDSNVENSALSESNDPIMEKPLDMPRTDIEGVQDDFSIENGVLIRYNGPGGAVVIPNNVTKIRHEAFHGCNGITSIAIPNSVTDICDYAFWGCSGLTDITIPNSVTEIGSSAFWGCSGLTSIIIPNSVTFIGGYAFDDCSGLTDITIPNSVTYIGGGAFSNCSGLTGLTIPSSVIEIEYDVFVGCSGLRSITIPSSVAKIADSAFNDCTSLTNINVDTSNNNYSTVDGVLYTKDKTGLVITPAGIEGVFTIPNSVTEIADRAFSGCSRLTRIVIPNSVREIGNGAFTGCSGLTNITIPSSVMMIGNNAFNNCNELTSITIPNSVVVIGNGAFNGCSKLANITIPSNVIVIGNDAYNLEAVMPEARIANQFQDDSDYIQAYIEKIIEIENEYEDSSRVEYNLIYLDEDIIPELVVDVPGYYVSVYTYCSGKLYTIMDKWGYGAFGISEYDYIPKENVIRNYDADQAGLIVWEFYGKVNENYEIQSYYDKPLSIWLFQDLNKNYTADDGEYDETNIISYYYYGEQEITSEEYELYQKQGNFSPICGVESAPRIILRLLFNGGIKK